MLARPRGKRVLGRRRGRGIRRVHLVAAALALRIAALALRTAASGRRAGSVARTTTRVRTEIMGSSRIRTGQRERLRVRIQTPRNLATVPEIRIRRRMVTRPVSRAEISWEG